MNRRLYVTGAVSASLAILSGITTYAQADIPFGIAFTLSLNATLLFLEITLLTISLRLYRSLRRWVRWTSILPLVTVTAVLVLQVAVQTDPRVIHYLSIPPSPETREWQEDARFLSEQLAEKHANLFALVDSMEWNALTQDIVDRIPSVRDSDILMELTRLVGFPKDGHTFPFIMAPCFDIHSFPLVLYGFPEGWYVVRTARELSELTGTRLLSIQGVPIDTIYDTYSQLIAWENQQSRKEHFTFMTVMAEWLAYHRIIDNTDRATFAFRTVAGDTVVRTITSVDFWPYFLWTSDIEIENDEPPVFTAPRKDAYVYRLLEDGRVLYIQVNQCVEPPDQEPMTTFAQSVAQTLAEYPVERCILDLRNNDGGQRIYPPLIDVLRNDRAINRTGKLFVLIGRRTFSAAVTFATELQLQTEALFIGEPTGQGPIFYSRPRLIELPHSGLLFTVSSYHNIAGLPFDDRKAIEPDIAVPYGIRDFRQGLDPVLERALSYTAAAEQTPSRIALWSSGVVGRYVYNETTIMDISASDGSLQLSISDGLPNSSVRFSSPLRDVSPNVYSTRLHNVTVLFTRQGAGAPNGAMLDWMGTSVGFTRAPEGFELPFEHFGKGDVVGGCAMLEEDAAKYTALYPNLEGILNTLGYQYLRSGETKDALQVFHLNVMLYPHSANVYDSYGEALMVDDQIDSSIANYQRSLELNPGNGNAQRVIARLRELLQE